MRGLQRRGVATLVGPHGWNGSGSHPEQRLITPPTWSAFQRDGKGWAPDERYVNVRRAPGHLHPTGGLRLPTRRAWPASPTAGREHLPHVGVAEDGLLDAVLQERPHPAARRQRADLVDRRASRDGGSERVVGDEELVQRDPAPVPAALAGLAPGRRPDRHLAGTL